LQKGAKNVPKSGKLLERLQTCDQKNDLANHMLTKGSGWVGGCKSCFIECLPQ
jgi:hypothetical protein